ncbi:MAG: rod shape-determining protein RodA [Verrucomicrobiae bacterium]|nr:rod shape-determining protein RodA [Verrucomicrobiae bacterium]
MKRLTLRQKLENLDWVLLFVVVLCAVAGIACIYSATWISERPELRVAYQRQAFWAAIGLVACFIVSLIDYQLFLKWVWIFFGGAIAVLLLVLLVGREVHGAKSWLAIGSLSVQPAEFTKVCFIIFLAWFLTKQGKNVRSLSTFLISCAVMGVFMILILKQPDLGSAAVFIPIAFAMMFVGGVAKRWLALGGVLGVVGAVLAFFFKLKPYQKARLATFLNPSLDVSGAGYHLNQSKIAIGSGGLSGKGFMEGTQNMLGFLPRDVSFSDFIFSVIGEEFGFIGGVALILAFTFILFSALRISMRSRDLEGSLVATGVVMLFFAHIFENIGMTIGVTPITGIPLPFISYGGSFVLSCFIAIGLLQSVHIHRRVY